MPTTGTPAPRGGAPARPAHRITLTSRDPEVLPKVLRSAPPGSRELSIPAVNRGRLSDTAKTFYFSLTYNDRPAVIAVTANEDGQLVTAYVGGALATVVSERVLMTKKKQQSRVGGPSHNDPLRQSEEGDAEAVLTLGENLAAMKCPGSAVAKTVLESLDFQW